MRATASTPRRPAPVTKKKPAPVTPAVPAVAVGPLRLGAIAGATPGTWIDRWQERMPRTPLELIPVAVAEQSTLR